MGAEWKGQNVIGDTISEAFTLQSITCKRKQETWQLRVGCSEAFPPWLSSNPTELYDTEGPAEAIFLLSVLALTQSLQVQQLSANYDETINSWCGSTFLHQIVALQLIILYYLYCTTNVLTFWDHFKRVWIAIEKLANFQVNRGIFNLM